MKTLLHERVNHKRFGEGIIIMEEEEQIIVDFAKMGCKKTFQYPEAFECFLSIQNPGLKKGIAADVEDKKSDLAAQKVVQRLEFEKKMEDRRLEKIEQKKKK